MKKHGFVAFTLFLAGCQMTATTDINSIWFRIRPGSQLVLNQPLEIPAGQAHVDLQNGQVAGGVDEYTVNCRFEVEQAEVLMRREGIRWLNSTNKSIEEIATTILRELRIERHVY